MSPLSQEMLEMVPDEDLGMAAPCDHYPAVSLQILLVPRLLVSFPSAFACTAGPTCSREDTIGPVAQMVWRHRFM